MSPHYQELLGKLDGVRRRLRLVAVLSGMADTAVGLLITAPFIFLLDNWLHFSTASRLAGCLIILAVAGSLFGKRVRLAFQRWRYVQLALRVEERYPELENRLINTIQLSGTVAAQGPLAAAMIDSVAQEAMAETQGRNLGRAVENADAQARPAGGAAAGRTGLALSAFDARSISERGVADHAADPRDHAADPHPAGRAAGGHGGAGRPGCDHRGAAGQFGKPAAPGESRDRRRRSQDSFYDAV